MSIFKNPKSNISGHKCHTMHNSSLLRQWGGGALDLQWRLALEPLVKNLTIAQYAPQLSEVHIFGAEKVQF